MKNVKDWAVFLFCCLLTLTSYGQSFVKLGLGGASLGSGGKQVLKMEVEGERNLSKHFSASLLLGLGYGDLCPQDAAPPPGNTPMPSGTTERYPAFIAQVDGSIFYSPLGNDKLYNLKIGTGPSLLYIDGDVEEATEYYVNEPERLSLGISMILENEFKISEVYTVGIKGMLQPYLSGDTNLSLLLKAGRRF